MVPSSLVSTISRKMSPKASVRTAVFDPLDALEHALQAGVVGHIQAQDIQIDERARTRYGVFGKTAGRTSPTDVE
jgi:hypothetical protein